MARANNHVTCEGPRRAAFACRWAILAMGIWLLPAGAPAQDLTPVALAQSCANCHGPGGKSPGAIPAIANLSADKMATALREFRSGERQGTIMNRIARGYTDPEIEALSQYLATQNDEARP